MIYNYRLKSYDYRKMSNQELEKKHLYLHLFQQFFF